jgi:hypothetical protein
MDNPKNYDDKTLFINKISYGVIIGIISPVIFFILNYIFRFRQYNFTDYMRFLIESRKLISVISLTVFPNIIPFMLFINSNRYSSGRGVLTSTVILCILIFIFYFFQ